MFHWFIHVSAGHPKMQNLNVKLILPLSDSDSFRINLTSPRAHEQGWRLSVALRTVSARSSLGGGVPEGPTPGHCGRGSGGYSGQCNPRTSHFSIRAGGKGEPKQNAALIIGHVGNLYFFSLVSLSSLPLGRREGGAKAERCPYNGIRG